MIQKKVSMTQFPFESHLKIFSEYSSMSPWNNQKKLNQIEVALFSKVKGHVLWVKIVIIKPVKCFMCTIN